MIGRWLLAFGAPLSLLTVPALALAEEPPGCPPDEWFCDDPEPLAPEAAPEPDAVPPEGEAPEDAELPEQLEGEQSSTGELDTPAPPAEDRRWSASARSPWGFALRGEGVLLDDGGRNARLWGVGASVRYSLNPVITLDLGLDSIVGDDYNGYDHSEVALSLSSVLYLNPSDVVRTFVLVGLSLSSARVDLGAEDQSWGYFGGHAGLGLEFPLEARIALAVEAVGFMRGRTDSRAAREPEFTDGSGRVTNTSGGGLVRAGVVLRF
jgi:hypothetical protein